LQEWNCIPVLKAPIQMPAREAGTQAAVLRVNLRSPHATRR
jgi:hypothetical protein